MKKKFYNNEETHPLTWRIQNRKNTIFIKEYEKKRGYLALKYALKNMSPLEVINEVKKSKLKGRGGAGFFTGIKWSLMPKNYNSNKSRYLLCNADEMEPGTYKDRFLMETLPHLLLEGIILSSYAIESSCSYIFLRDEYFLAKILLEKSILEAKNNGYIGKNILNSGFDLEIFIHSGAGRYICGEETALINSLEGKRPNPRSKPPFPSEKGLWNKPTCVNNVETLSNIPAIILNGSYWYNNISNNSDTGTKLMGFSGKVNNPGLWEVPFGITAREILEDYAKGMKKGYQLKAWLPGGSGTGLLTEFHLDTPMDFKHISLLGSRLGTAISIAIDNTINIVSLLLNIEIFFSRESCGWCTPCREGLPWLVKILQDIVNKKGKIGDIELLEDICRNLDIGKTFCAFAPGAISPLHSSIKYFRKEFESGIDLSSSLDDKKISGIQKNNFNS
ncbi:NADH-quinone oxidoreductase subunit NuoF [Buchnera aphidicola (Ceratoglyphina bambusae)]|uniref:NADH-quinone oxidoreductase subunit NuoF n=1 Tax=Buchnera aphidicola TaxID=9 RepID=UPI0031B82514